MLTNEGAYELNIFLPFRNDAGKKRWYMNHFVSNHESTLSPDSLIFADSRVESSSNFRSTN